MPVPTGAFSQAVPFPDGTQDVPLFRDPPPKPPDNAIGFRPNPRGETKDVNHDGGLFPSTIDRSFQYPPLGLDPPESDEWTAVPAFAESERTLVESHEFIRQGDQLVTKIKLRGVQTTFVWRGWFRIPALVFTFARLRGTYSLSWVRQR